MSETKKLIHFRTLLWIYLSHRIKIKITRSNIICITISHVNIVNLTAKSDVKFSLAPTLKTLSMASNVELCGKTFRQLEWMVGQHVKWRLLAPTPVTFATLLAQYVVADSDLTTRHPKFVRRFKRDGIKLLEAYLDLTLSGNSNIYEVRCSVHLLFIFQNLRSKTSLRVASRFGCNLTGQVII